MNPLGHEVVASVGQGAAVRCPGESAIAGDAGATHIGGRAVAAEQAHHAIAGGGAGGRQCLSGGGAPGAVGVGLGACKIA